MLPRTVSDDSARADDAVGGDALRIGLEHEFVVHGPQGVVDFRSVVHGLALGQPNLDPADPHAYRLRSGASVTCDAAEAEIALPPTFIGPGFAFEVAWRAEAEHAALHRRLGGEVRLQGYSTHISVSVSDALTQAVCRMYATTFAPAMIQLADRQGSPGLLIRPRPGRVELGANYLKGGQLVAAAVFAVASVRTCVNRLRTGARDDLPSELEMEVVPAVDRFGWYVDRKAFGVDLLAGGRSTELRTTGGEALTAQRHLEDCWRVARRTIEATASPGEVAAVDLTVRGDHPLPSERITGEPVTAWGGAPLSQAAPFGDALVAVDRPSFDVAPVMLTWDLAVFLVRDRRHGHRAFMAVPGLELGPFLRDLNSGRLDETVRAFMRQRRSRRVLRQLADVTGPTLFHEMGPRIGLLRAEFGHDGRLMALPIGGAPRVRAGRPWLAWRAAFANLRLTRVKGSA